MDDRLEIYMMRHGPAQGSASSPSGDDRDRPLSPKGIEEMTQAARGLAAAGVRFTRILSSPYRRALETARIVAQAQPEKPKVEVLESLAAGVVYEDLSSELTRERIAGKVLLVGHEPDMGSLVGGLIGSQKGGHIPFSPGTIARVDLDAWPPGQDGSLIWLMTPQVAGSLAD